MQRIANVKRPSITRQQLIELMDLCVYTCRLKGQPMRFTHALKLVRKDFKDHPSVKYWDVNYLVDGNGNEQDGVKHGYPPGLIGLWNSTNGYHGHVTRTMPYNFGSDTRALMVMIHPESLLSKRQTKIDVDRLPQNIQRLIK